MAARSGMATLITELRSRTNASSSDYSLIGEGGTATYWSDDHLEARLDRHRRDYTRVPLIAEPEYVDPGTPAYHDYYWQKGRFVEEASSGTAAWRVEDGAGSAIGTASYTVDYEAQTIRFTADQAGSARYLNYRAYDLDRAAAGIWREKAAHVADRFDVQTDNHRLSRSQLRMGYLEMAAHYERQAPARSVTRVRNDLP